MLITCQQEDGELRESPGRETSSRKSKLCSLSHTDISHTSESCSAQIGWHQLIIGFGDIIITLYCHYHNITFASSALVQRHATPAPQDFIHSTL